MLPRNHRCSRHLTGAGLALTLLLAPMTAKAQITIAPFYAGSYSFTNLGTPSGVPTQLGGVVVKAGDNNTLLIGGAANTASGALYNVAVNRGAGNRITSFNGTATLFGTAPNIDGGLSYGPNGVLFATGFPNNTLLQYKPGSTTPDKIINLSTLPTPISSSVGTLQFVPTGSPGAGRFKIASYNSSNFYDVTLTPDANGTFDISSVSLISNIGGGPEGIIYVPAGSPLFANPSMLVSEFGSGRVSSYEVNANGDPILATRRDFITGLSGAEGANLDPLTNDFIFSTFGGSNQVIVVQGFAAPVATAAPEPGTAVLLFGGIGTLFVARRRRTK
jgi:hypothetical protein